MTSTDKTHYRAKVAKYIELNLGAGLVDVEFDAEHLDMSLDRALAKYRQRSSRAVEESYMVLNLTKGESNYYLPEEVINVRTIYRRGIGTSGGTGTSFDPFAAAFANMYMLNASGSQGLATFELYMGKLELLGRMFGAHLTFVYNPVSHMLSITRNIKADEPVVLQTYNYKPDEMIIADPSSGPWIKDYALAVAKMLLGQARSKFTTLAGPQGGVTLNGAELLAQGQAEIVQLEEDIRNFCDGGTPPSFLFG